MAHLKGEMVQLTKKLVEAELARDEWEENFKKVARDSFNIALRQVEYFHPKVGINKSLCNLICEISNGDFCIWIDGALVPTRPGLLAL